MQHNKFPLGTIKYYYNHNSPVVWLFAGASHSTNCCEHTFLIFLILSHHTWKKAVQRFPHSIEQSIKGNRNDIRFRYNMDKFSILEWMQVLFWLAQLEEMECRFRRLKQDINFELHQQDMRGSVDQSAELGELSVQMNYVLLEDLVGIHWWVCEMLAYTPRLSYSCN